MCGAGARKSPQKKELWFAAAYEIVGGEPMSEFKFACPVCGQHITADSSSSGGQIECPTCFQKIVVPQAPTSADTKFILSASQVSKPRPAPTDAGPPAVPVRRSSFREYLPTAAVLLSLLCAAGAAVYVFRARLFPAPPPPKQTKAKETTKHKVGPPAKSSYSIATNIVWTLDLADAALPQSTAAGSIRGAGFVCERSTLEGGALTLRQGNKGPPDLGVTVLLPFQPGQTFNGKTVQVAPGQAPPVPRVILRWKDDQQQPGRQNVNSGYALKLAFGQAANGRMPGRIYLCVPDQAKSFVAGSFDAEIRKPKPAQPGAGKPKPKRPPPG
jgi:hypothetical protein